LTKIAVILIIFTSFPLLSDDFERLLENYFGQRTPTPNNFIDISQIQDKYDIFSKNPININTTSLIKLQNLPLVNDNILKKLRDSGPYTTNTELMDTINSYQIEKIMKFILIKCLSTVKTTKTRNGINYIARNQSILQDRKGFTDKRYLDSELGLYQKININYNDFELNSVIDKDAGEIYLNDFTSISAKYDNEDFKAILGDYNLSFGLGNVYDQSFLSLKNTDFINTSTEYGYGAEINRSTLENNFFRGIYTEYNFTYDFKVSTFYSNINRGATLDKKTNLISSIYQSGYYRTGTEIEKVGVLNEKLVGLDIQYNYNDFSFGILSTYLNYNKEIKSSSSSSFNGKNGLISSIYGAFNVEDNSFKYELGVDANNNISFRTNYLLAISNNVSFLTDLRYAAPNYRAPYASNFGEQSFVSNEKGILTGIVFSKGNYYLSLFSDIYSTELSTFTTKHPVKGAQFFTDFRLKDGKQEYSFRLNYERKSDSFTSDSINSKLTIPYDKINARFDINTNLGLGLRLRARAEISYKLNEYTESETGNLFLLEIKKRDNNLNLYYGISFISFNTTSFESVIYGFQYQVPGLAYVYPFYQNGNNISLFLKYDFYKYLDLWIRFNNLYKNNNENIGSGYEEIQGNNRSQVIFQVQLKIN